MTCNGPVASSIGCWATVTSCPILRITVLALTRGKDGSGIINFSPSQGWARKPRLFRAGRNSPPLRRHSVRLHCLNLCAILVVLRHFLPVGSNGLHFK